MIEKDELLSIVPHRGRMLLLSRIKEYNTTEGILQGEYDITTGCLFYDPAAEGVPAWAGFEIIAQGISALSGLRDREMGRQPKFGFILSVSSMWIGIPFIKAGSTVEIKIKEIGRMDSVFAFEGEIFHERKKILSGKITAMDVDEKQVQILKKEQNTIG